MSKIDRIVKARMIHKIASTFVVNLIEEEIEGVEYDQWHDIFHSAAILLNEYQGKKL